jgi:hypothetical protein
MIPNRHKQAFHGLLAMVLPTQLHGRFNVNCLRTYIASKMLTKNKANIYAIRCVFFIKTPIDTFRRELLDSWTLARRFFKRVQCYEGIEIVHYINDRLENTESFDFDYLLDRVKRCFNNNIVMREIFQMYEYHLTYSTPPLIILYAYEKYEKRQLYNSLPSITDSEWKITKHMLTVHSNHQTWNNVFRRWYQNHNHWSVLFRYLFKAFPVFKRRQESFRVFLLCMNRQKILLPDLVLRHIYNYVHIRNFNQLNYEYDSRYNYNRLKAKYELDFFSKILLPNKGLFNDDELIYKL